VISLLLLLACSTPATFDGGEITVQPPADAECSVQPFAHHGDPGLLSMTWIALYDGEVGSQVLCGTETAAYTAGIVDGADLTIPAARFSAAQQLYTSVPLAAGEPVSEGSQETQDFTVASASHRRVVWMERHGNQLRFAAYNSAADTFDAATFTAWRSAVEFNR